MKKAYPTYKETDLPWVDKLPSTWKVERAKYVFQAINERSETGEETLLSVSEHHGVIPRSQANVTMFQAESYVGYKLCKPADLVINSLWAWSRGLGFSEYRGIISTAYDVFRLRNSEQYDYKYFDYLLRTNLYVGEYICRSKGIWISRLQLGTGAFLEIPILLPSPAEQHQIAAYLDHKCALIDTFIAKKKRLIELLQEQKQAIINQVVTRGIDPNVPLKPSGVDWLGDIPEHWKISRLRYQGRLQNGISAGAEFFGKGFPFVSYSDVYKNVELPHAVNGLADASKEERERFSVLEGDVFFTRTSETIEEIGLSSTCTKTLENGTFAGFLIRYRPFKRVLAKEFSKHYFRCQKHRAYFIKEMNLVIRASLSQELLKGLPVLIPPIEEQRQIGEYLDKELQTIDQTIVRIQSEIDLTKEYKTTLIAEAVTGKIDVRGWRAEETILSQTLKPASS